MAVVRNEGFTRLSQAMLVLRDEGYLEFDRIFANGFERNSISQHLCGDTILNDKYDYKTCGPHSAG
ncbi:hypothetical protein RJZ56_006953 [Blastomyces dermatitidis]|uniref:Uncharacterized protein n=2 Tax=Ajellomyces dermatitidis TaxID=5039 RepID=F2TH16_AJEDA|nr:uncharacterized protein BDCG_06302 [Blastomyces dermatitidis ER-3]EEQ91182.2 hypothetical protein BDCG_06302 [Blastomyces dermatitidis ER-3]EGE82529.2 hypothetical protein BDDG_05473 [Blastomyces dermatitidis ATCC 18188]